MSDKISRADSVGVYVRIRNDINKRLTDYINGRIEVIKIQTVINDALEAYLKRREKK